MLPNNLPPSLTRFIGREREIAALSHLLTGEIPPADLLPPVPRLVTLTGVGGSGKTRLALETARSLVESAAEHDFPDGLWLIPLASLTDPAAIPLVIINKLGLRESPASDPASLLVNALSNRKILLVVDNCEHLLDGCARLFESILPACPQVTILATSRAPLNLPGELIFPVPPLEIVNPSSQLPTTNLVQCESVRLFEACARRAQPDFSLTDQNSDAVLQICRHLDGLPLAIELAAARVRSLTPQEIADLLADRLFILHSAGAGGLERHQNLHATFEWSWRLLSPPEQVLFNRLAVFEGGWSREAAAEVAADGQADGLAVLDLLERLLDQSLIKRMDRVGDSRSRYFMLQPVRQYALEKLAESGEMDLVKDRHLAYFESLGRQAWEFILTPDYMEAVDRFGLELNNFRAALNWSLAGGPIGSGMSVAISLFHYWIELNCLRESVGTFQKLVESPNSAAPTTVHARTLAFYSLSLLRLGLAERAQAAARESLAIEKLAPDENVRAYALSGLGHALGLLGFFPAAFDALNQSVALFRRSSYMPGIGWSLSRLGLVAHKAGDYQLAGDTYREMTGLMRTAGIDMYLKFGLREWAHALLKIKDYPQAQKILTGLLDDIFKVKEFSSASLIPIADLCLEYGYFEPAARLLGKVSAELDGYRTILLPQDLERFEKDRARLAALSSPQDFNAGWEAGSALTLEQVFQEARALLSLFSPAGSARPVYPCGLTGRELEVLRFLSLGLTNQEIANRLVISRRTVHAHLRAIYGKLEVSSRTAAVREANRLNLTG